MARMAVTTMALVCPGCGSPTETFGVDGVRGLVLRCTLLPAHMYVMRRRDIYEAPTDLPPGWVPTDPPVATAPVVYDTCPRCERQVEVQHAGSDALGEGRWDPWQFIEHRRMRESGAGGEVCPGSGGNRFGAMLAG
jgi:hypothetical protein